MSRFKTSLGLTYGGPGPESFDEAVSWAVEDFARMVTDEAHLQLAMGKSYEVEKAKCGARLAYLKQLKEYAHEL